MRITSALGGRRVRDKGVKDGRPSRVFCRSEEHAPIEQFVAPRDEEGVEGTLIGTLWAIDDIHCIRKEPMPMVGLDEVGGEAGLLLLPRLAYGTSLAARYLESPRTLLDLAG